MSDAETAETAAFILAGTSAVALVAGGVLYYFGRRGPERAAPVAPPAEVTAAPALLSGGAGLVVEGRF